LNVGDFGDPIFEWINYRWIQVGLASYCRMSNSPGVFTNLAAYSDWIDSISNIINLESRNIYRCDKKASCGCGQIDVALTSSRITDSEQAIKHSWPMIVSVQSDNRHTCGGTILSNSFILTSAECVYFFKYGLNFNIIAGIHKIFETVTVSRQVDQIYLHPNYSRERSGVHDIAIAHLVQPLPFDDISSILAKTCVPIESELSVNEYPEKNLQLAVVGWSSTAAGTAISDVLQQIYVRLLDSKHELCASFPINDTYQFCVELPNNNKSGQINYSCYGNNS
jgi:secreted trypsin-like serine protease